MTAIGRVRKVLRPIKRLVVRAGTRLKELLHLLGSPPIGSPGWLKQAEVRYGGIVTDVVRRTVSPHDTRTAVELATGGMTGGDRMLHHNYAETYARNLAPFLTRKGLTIAEFGILKGTGLAIWCDLFSEACVLGFDIDTEYFNANRELLIRRGAFRRTTPQVHEYDQLVDGSGKLAEILDGRTLDIVIDDGLHSIEAIVMTWRSVRPHLSRQFVYFVEDYEGLADSCRSEFAPYDCWSIGMMTVISAGGPRAGG